MAAVGGKGAYDITNYGSGCRKVTYGLTNYGSGWRKETSGITNDGSGWRKETYGITIYGSVYYLGDGYRQLMLGHQHALVSLFLPTKKPGMSNVSLILSGIAVRAVISSYSPFLYPLRFFYLVNHSSGAV